MGNKKHPFFLFAFLSLCLAVADCNSPVRAEEQVPPELKNISIDPILGTTVPLDLTFSDEAGKTVALRSFFKQNKPVILTLVYYECPMLCTLVLNGLTDGMKALPWTPGKEFEIVTVSFNPLETRALAQAKKSTYMQAYGRPEAAKGWHFLVGKEAAIKPLANAVGFKYAWDPAQKQYAHATGIFFLTPQGKLSRVLFGIDYPARDLRLALTEAAEGKIGTVVDKLLLFCFHYDPKTKGYALAAFRVVQLAGLLTVVFLGGLIGSLLVWERRRRGMALAAPAPAAPEGEQRESEKQVRVESDSTGTPPTNH